MSDERGEVARACAAERPVKPDPSTAIRVGRLDLLDSDDEEDAVDFC